MANSLHQQYNAKLKSSALTTAVADKLRIKACTREESKEFGLSHAGDGIYIQYFDADGNPIDFFRYRYFKDPRNGFKKLTDGKPIRYEQQADTIPEVYLPPLLKDPWTTVHADPNRPMMIVEGELKAAAGTKHIMPTAGLGGVRSISAKKRGIDILPWFDQVAWGNREVIIAFDSDVETNPDVLDAETRLAIELTARGAKVRLARIPAAADGSKLGLDDFIAAKGVAATKRIIKQAKPFITANHPPGVISETITGQLEITAKGNYVASVNNLMVVLRAADVTGFEIGRDSFREQLMITPTDKREWRPFQDEDYTMLRLVLENRGFLKISHQDIRSCVHLQGRENTFDSAIVWLTDEVPPWDGSPRCENFLTTYFGADHSAYTRAVGNYIWSALTGRVLTPGCKADMVPILVGPQGILKSTGLSKIPPDLEFFTDDISLRDKDDDLARKLRGILVAEISELKGLRSRDLESIKALTSRTHDKWVPKYVEFAARASRRFLLFGTTNQDEFLGDATGERRWLPVKVTKVDIAAIERDRLQLWAEGRHLFEQHGVMFQDPEALAGTAHDEHKITDSWEQPISGWLSNRNHTTPFTIYEVLERALELHKNQMDKAAEMRAADVLRGLGCVKEKNPKVINGQQRRCWISPRIGVDDFTTPKSKKPRKWQAATPVKRDAAHGRGNFSTKGSKTVQPTLLPKKGRKR